MVSLKQDLSFDPDSVVKEKTYPFNDQVAVIEHVHRRYGMEAVRKMGRFYIDDIGKMRYILSKIAPPKKIIEAIIESNSKLMTRGKHDLKDIPTGVEVRVDEIIDNDIFLELWIGLFEGVLTITRRKNGSVTVLEKTFDKNSSSVLFRITW